MNSTKKRKFNIWDNNELTVNMERVLQILDKIETTSLEDKVEIVNLPMSVVPTYILYDLAVGFEGLYLKLMEHELLVGGYVKETNSQH